MKLQEIENKLDRLVGKRFGNFNELEGYLKGLLDSDEMFKVKDCTLDDNEFDFCCRASTEKYHIDFYYLKGRNKHIYITDYAIISWYRRPVSMLG